MNLIRALYMNPSLKNMSPSSSSRKSPIQSISWTWMPPVAARSPNSAFADVNCISRASKSDIPGVGTCIVKSTDLIFGLLWAELSKGSSSAATESRNNIFFMTLLAAVYEDEPFREDIFVVYVLDFQ